MSANRVTQIEKNVPIPSPPRVVENEKPYADFGRVSKKGPSLKYPFRLMEVGDSILIDAGDARKAKEAVRKTSYRYPDLSFRHLTDPATGEVRIWRVA